MPYHSNVSASQFLFRININSYFRLASIQAPSYQRVVAGANTNLIQENLGNSHGNIQLATLGSGSSATQYNRDNANNNVQITVGAENSRQHNSGNSQHNTAIHLADCEPENSDHTVQGSNNHYVKFCVPNRMFTQIKEGFLKFIQ